MAIDRCLTCETALAANEVQARLLFQESCVLGTTILLGKLHRLRLKAGGWEGV